MTFFGEYGTGNGRSDEIPSSIFKDYRELISLAKKIIRYQEQSEKGEIKMKDKCLVLIHVNQFIEIYEKTYGQEKLIKKDFFTLAKDLMKEQENTSYQFNYVSR